MTQLADDERLIEEAARSLVAVQRLEAELPNKRHRLVQKLAEARERGLSTTMILRRAATNAGDALTVVSLTKMLASLRNRRYRRRKKLGVAGAPSRSVTQKKSGHLDLDR